MENTHTQIRKRHYQLGAAQPSQWRSSYVLYILPLSTYMTLHTAETKERSLLPTSI